MSNPQFYANGLLKELKISSVPVKPREIAEKLEIFIQETEAGDRYDGYLLPVDGSFGIMLNKSITNEARKNFTIAHELGHARITEHNRKESKCFGADIGVKFVKEQREKEANEFAAGLLMPEFFMQDQVSYREITFNQIKNISEQCETSLTSSALQYIKFCPEIAAIVVSQNGVIKYFSRTEEMAKRKMFTNPGSRLSKLSIAHDFMDTTNKTSISGRRDEVDIRAWFPGENRRDYKCIEDVVVLPSQNQVISLLYLEECD